MKKYSIKKAHALIEFEYWRPWADSWNIYIGGHMLQQQSNYHI